ncbi:hypothetical protein CIW83_18925 [Tissierella sp. P1]|uniref:hypothetical protein n=1 Tax=Tissierella TaxID=41273 RepID=UPI000BA09D96|nr:hypothetical protein [Tissierella sp. P1]OZV10659.1 hypothetical protein CIW83_18925 [Tissierella sp. P1]
MFTKKRKVIYSLIAALMLSSSAANAASFDLANFDCNSILNNYIKEYGINFNYDSNENSNTQQDTTDSSCSKFDWTAIVNKLGNCLTIPTK